MKAHKSLIAGIIFLVVQLIALIVNGFNFPSGAYGAGYLVGFFAPGIIGIIFLIVYFTKRKA